MENAEEELRPLHFEGDNSFPECECCGHCCELNVLAVMPDELERMRAYVAAHNVAPIDYGKERCCFQTVQRTCMIWEARPQPCRLHNCHVPRREVLRRNPAIHVPENPPLLDLHDCFIGGQAYDPRFRPLGEAV